MKKALKSCLSLILALTIILSSAYVGLREVDFGKVNVFLKKLAPDFSIEPHAANVGDLKFTLSSNGTFYIVSCSNMNISGEVIIPEKHNNLPVTVIANQGFSNCQAITSVIIPNTISRIPESAFMYCESLTNVTIPDSVTCIDANAFRFCKSLANIVIPKSVTSIGRKAFTDTNFYNNTANWENNALYLGDILIAVNPSVVGSFSVLNGTRIIAGDAFYCCTSITDIELPETLISICDFAFCGCRSLTSITIPQNIPNIGIGLFEYCESLTNITIPDNVTNISAYMFAGCKSLTSIVFPSNVTSIDYKAFENCDSLTSITIPDTVTTLGNYIFAGCDSLISITLSKGIVNMAYDAFYDCDSIKYVFFTGSNSEWEYGQVLKRPKIIHYNSVDHTCEWNTKTSPTCTETGLKVYTCVYCSFPKDTEVLDALGHNYSTQWTIEKEPTCTNTGLKSHHCVICGEKTDITIIPINKNNHIMKNGECTECGYWANKSKAVKLNSISNKTSGVTVKWSKLEGADKYNVYRSTYSNGKWSGWKSIKSGITKTYYTDTTTKSGNYYRYTVKAINGSGSSKYNSTGLKIKYLASTKISSATKTSTGVIVTWSKVAGASGYYVYRKAGSGDWSRIGTVKSGSTVKYTDKNTKTGVLYTYKICAYSGDYKSEYSSTKTYIRLTSPKMVSLTNSYSGLTVKWETVKGAEGYYVYRKAGSAKSWSKIATIKKGSTYSYTDENVKSGTKYKYTVKAYNGSVKTSYADNEKTLLRVGSPKLSSASSNSKGVKISWKKVSSADGYYVYRKVGSSSSWSKIATIKSGSTISYTDKNVKSGTKYIYTVKAYDGSISGAYNKTGKNVLYLTYRDAVKKENKRHNDEVETLERSYKSNVSYYNSTIDKLKNNYGISYVYDDATCHSRMNELQDEIYTKERKLNMMKMDTSGVYDYQIKQLEAEINELYNEKNKYYIMTQINVQKEKIERCESEYYHDLRIENDYHERMLKKLESQYS